MNPYQLIVHNTTDKNITVELLTDKPIPEGIELELWHGNDKLSYDTFIGELQQDNHGLLRIYNIPKRNIKTRQILIRFKDLYGREYTMPHLRQLITWHHYAHQCSILLKVKAGGYSFLTFTL